jgi:predicted nucleic acid-binding protein
MRPRARDPSDNMLLETALNGRADRLVTLNTGDFIAAEQFWPTMLQPRERLSQLRGEQS